MSTAFTLGRTFGTRLSALARAHAHAHHAPARCCPVRPTAGVVVGAFGAAGVTGGGGVGGARVGSLVFKMLVSTLPRLPVFEAIARHDPDSTVVVHSGSGRRFRYGELLGDVCKTRDRLCHAAGRSDLDGERIAFLVENSYDYVGKPITNSPPSRLAIRGSC